MNKPTVKAGIFSVKRDDWELFLEMMEDSAGDFSTWENWKLSVDQTKIDLFNQRIDAVEVMVDLEEFEEWCDRQNLPKNGASRSQYAAEALKKNCT